MASQQSRSSAIRVLVTGASGFLAIHCVQKLLLKDYVVRGTVRDITNNEKTQPLWDLIGSKRLELIEADLTEECVWDKAMENCTFVLHVASPCPIIADESIVDVAVRGTLNVLKAAARCDTVHKVVITSSCGAVNEGHNDRKKVFDETDWSNLNSKHLHPYHRSKTLAEQAAWEFYNDNPSVSFKLTVLNPCLLVGPLLQNSMGSSAKIISRFVDGSMPAVPSLTLGLVDVRDVADVHILSLEQSNTDGERILLCTKSLSFMKIAKILRKEFGPKGYRTPKFKAPVAALWIYSLFDREAKQALRLNGHKDNFNTSKAKDLFGIEFIPIEQSLTSMVHDMLERGLIPKKEKNRR